MDDTTMDYLTLRIAKRVRELTLEISAVTDHTQIEEEIEVCTRDIITAISQSARRLPAPE